MKVLYAIQGTGNGHIARAHDIVPLLKSKIETDVLISGIQSDIQSSFKVDYKCRGLSFIFGKKGGVDMYETFLKLKSKKFYDEIQTLPIKKYDLIINDFEPISAWAARKYGVPCIGLSHQSAVIHSLAPKPKSLDFFGQLVLQHYAPTHYSYGFHFQKYSDTIFTPVIRSSVREASVESANHYTVYLPSYSNEELIKHLSKFKKIKWQVFSKHTKKAMVENNISIFPIQSEHFLKSMASSIGVLCGAGFETPAEALYLKKKLLVVPMKGQYEQQCNATALKSMNVPVIKSLKSKHYDKIESWLETNHVIDVDYKNETNHILEDILNNHLSNRNDIDFTRWKF
jgi:uncharacterized protein (TIGR00661 family)